MSDNIETVLMRLFTGTGIHGLTGISNRRGNIIRPLLCLHSDDVYRFLNEQGYHWREDASNKESFHTRNYIRNELLPLIRKRFPRYEKAMGNIIDVSRDTVTLMNRLIDGMFDDFLIFKNNCLYVKSCVFNNDRSLFNHILATAIREFFHHHVKRSMIDEIFRRFIQQRGNNILFEDGQVRIKKVFQNGETYIEIAHYYDRHISAYWEYQIDIRKLPVECELSEIETTLLVADADYFSFEKNKTNKSMVFICIASQENCIVIRNRKKGDRIHLESGTKKVKDLLIEKKLDNDIKSCVPLIIIGSEIAAVAPGLLYNAENRVSNSFYVHENSKKVLAIARKYQYTIGV